MPRTSGFCCPAAAAAMQAIPVSAARIAAATQRRSRTAVMCLLVSRVRTEPGKRVLDGDQSQQPSCELVLPDMMPRQHPADRRKIAAVAEGEPAIVNQYALPNGWPHLLSQKALVQRPMENKSFDIADYFLSHRWK